MYVNGDLLPVGESLARFLCRAGRIERIQGIGQFMPGESNNRFVYHNHAYLSPNYGLPFKIGNLFLKEGLEPVIIRRVCVP